MIAMALVMLLASLIVLVIALACATAELLVPFFAAMVLIWLAAKLYDRWFKEKEKEGP